LRARGAVVASDDRAAVTSRDPPQLETQTTEASIAFARAAGCLIVILLAACDNVSWGGADVTVLPPPPRPSGAPEPGIEPGAERLPDGPILFEVEASGSTATIRPVAEIAGDSLLPLRATADVRAYGENFIAEHLRQGSEFVLFREGVRAGTFIVNAATLEEGACGLAPRATGSVELGQAGAGAREFLAIARVNAPAVPRRAPEPLEATRTMRVLAPIYADQALRRRNAQLPGNWERAMADLRVIALGDARNAGFTATFLVGDTLGPGLDDAGHSVFFVAMPAQLSYDTVFVSFRHYPTTGKAAPRVVDFLDWDRDDSPELLLRVYGSRTTWLEAVGRGADGAWRSIFAGRCGPEGPAADSTQVPADTARTAADTMRAPRPNSTPPGSASSR
jgi:hypothetical protein